MNVATGRTNRKWLLKKLYNEYEYNNLYIYIHTLGVAKIPGSQWLNTLLFILNEKTPIKLHYIYIYVL